MRSSRGVIGIGHGILGQVDRSIVYRIFPRQRSKTRRIVFGIRLVRQDAYQNSQHTQAEMDRQLQQDRLLLLLLLLLLFATYDGGRRSAIRIGVRYM